MSDKPPEKESLADAFHQLGQSLVNTVQAAWNHPEREKFQAEIEKGLSDITATLEKEVETIRQSPTGQQLKSEMDEFAEKVRSGETAAQVRQELLKVLQIANTELDKAASRLRGRETSETPEPPPEKEE
jgi:vacuolar-type H+-ATPase subunit E/Vma4